MKTKNGKVKKTLGAVCRYGILSIVSLLSVFPLYWMAVSATNKSVDVLGITLLPGASLVENFFTIVDSYNLGGAMFNSFLNASLLTLAALLVCSIAGYGFEIYHSKGKDLLMNVLLLAMMIPFVATLVPLFRIFSQWGLLGTTIAVIMPTISTPFLIMLFRQSARNFPHDIIEAARLDGLNEGQIFFRMFIPTMRSTYAAAMTITFLNAWNNFLWPRVVTLTSKDAITMPVLINNMISGYVTDFGALMLAVLICTLPTIIIFFVLQRYFAEGITGAIK